MLLLRSASKRVVSLTGTSTKQWGAANVLLQHRSAFLPPLTTSSIHTFTCRPPPTTPHFQTSDFHKTARCALHSSTSPSSSTTTLPSSGRTLSSSPASHAFLNGILHEEEEAGLLQPSNHRHRHRHRPPHNNQDDPNPTPDFNNAEAAFQSKSTVELSRALLSFGLCQIPPLVRHSESLLKLTRALAGDTMTDALLKNTLFGHFCAGEDETLIQPTITKLQEAGIGSILDFAAEDDGEQHNHTNKEQDTAKHTTKIEVAPMGTTHAVKVRVYDYDSEAKCDRHVETFQKCIEDVANLQADGYAAMKVTALVNPILLERMSRAIVEAQNLFAKFDQDQDGFISKEEFERGLHLYFKDEDLQFKERMEQMVCPNKQSVDYITWSMSLAPHDLPQITAGCRENGPLCMTAPTEEEVELIERMYERGHILAKTASEHGTRLLVDAEQARFQPAIDNLVLDLQRTYNATHTTDIPIIYNTYQCYLKDAGDRLKTDVERSERHNYHFGAKLVRGAYMESERALAAAKGDPSPIHDTLQDTHDCYNDSVKFLLKHSKTSNKTTEVMCATHNQETIELAIEAMNEIGIDRKAQTICFAQLFGMMDNLTYKLGHTGFRAYKYVPYGPVKMVMPYLLRRANENSAIAGGAPKELEMITNELKRRLQSKLQFLN